MRTTIKPFRNVLTIVILILSAAATNAAAATFTVTNTNDSGAGSLRDALAQTGANNQPDTITFDPAVFNIQRTITLTSGELVVPPDSATTTGQMVTITGPGANLLTINGNNQSRVFYLDRYAQASMSGLTVTGGNGTGTTKPIYNNYGSGVFVYNGVLNLNNVVINNNGTTNNSDSGVFYNNALGSMIQNSTFSGNRDGICLCFREVTELIPANHTITNSNFTSNRNEGIQLGHRGATTVSNSIVENNLGEGIIAGNAALTVENTTIRGNTFNGIDKAGGGELNVRNSTVNNNSLGIFKHSAPEAANIINSTISNNVRTGILSLSGQTNIDSSTITLNRDRGVDIGFGDINLLNTIIAGNTASGAPADISGTLTSQGYNIVGTTTGGTIAPTMGDQFNVNPMLAPLANNGGATQTHALMSGSPAIDAANPTNFPAADQRGLTRPRDGDGNGSLLPDIGAFEIQIATAATVTVSGRVTAGRRGVARAVVYMTDQAGNSRTTRTDKLGFYRFDEVAAGQTYIFNAYSKQYQFNSQVVTINEDLDGLNFSAQR